MRKKFLVIFFILLLCFPVQVQAGSGRPTLNADWNANLNQISVTWGEISSYDNQSGSKYRLYYREKGSTQWKEHTSNIAWTSTGKGITNLISGSEYEFILRSGVEGALPSSNIATTKAINTAVSFRAEWTGNDILLEYKGVDLGFVNTGVKITVQSPDKAYNTTIFENNFKSLISNMKGNDNSLIRKPQENETWVVTFSYGSDTVTRTVNCWDEVVKPIGEVDSVTGLPVEDEPIFGSGPIPIFMQGSWEVIKFWYYVLASLSGAFIFLILIRSGYQHMVSSTSNPGLKESFAKTIERCVIGLIVIMTAPYFIHLLIQINDSFVHLFSNILDHVATGSFDLEIPQGPDDDKWLGKVIAFPFQAFINLINYFFGLHPLGDVIFNGHLNSTILTNNYLFQGGIQTGNPFTEALLNLALLGFGVYFNAVYTIRRWVVIAVLAVTPLIVWIWVLTSQRNVIEIWLSELFQTIFMQTWHALTFGIFFSILCFSGGALSISALASSAGSTAAFLISIGKWIAGLGGVICAGIIIAQGFRLAVAQNEKTVEEVKKKIQAAVLGLVILGLSLMIASFLTTEEIKIIDPLIKEQEVVKITFWQLFFVLVTIIPVSKMLSNVFMSILARFGTVDEHSEAGKASGMLTGLVALGGAAAGAARGKLSGVPELSSDTNIGDISSGAPRSSVNSKTSVMVPTGTAASERGLNVSEGLYSETQNTPNRGQSEAEFLNMEHFSNENRHSLPFRESNYMDELNHSGPINSGENPTIYEGSGYGVGGLYEEALEDFGGYPEEPVAYTGGVEILAPENPPSETPGIYEGDSYTKGSDPLGYPDPPVADKGLIKARETQFSHNLNQTQQKIDGVTDFGSKLGHAAGSFTGTSAGMAAFFGGTTRLMSAPVKTAYDLGRAAVQQHKANIGEEDKLSFTGRTTFAGAATQTLTAIALAPIGSSEKLSISAGRRIDKAFGGVDMYS